MVFPDVLTRVPQTTNSEFLAAIEAASHMYKSWRRWCAAASLCEQTKQRQQQTLVLGVSGYCRTETGYEKKHALVPSLSMREENWEHANERNWWCGQSTYEQELRTCWSKQMQIGLESDAASKCDGNRSRNVLYGTALFLSATCGHLYARREKREREKAEGTV